MSSIARRQVNLRYEIAMAAQRATVNRRPGGALVPLQRHHSGGIAAMIKTAVVALSAALGIAAVAHVSPVQADPAIRVGIRVPGLIVVAPYAWGPAYYRPYRVAYALPYWQRRFDRDDDARANRDWNRRDADRRAERRWTERHQR
jgi:hypothetical protein